MTTEQTHTSRRAHRRRRYVHLGAVAHLANGEKHVMIVRLDRVSNVVEFRARRSRHRYELALGEALTVLARYLDKRTAERALGTRTPLPIGPRML